MCAPLRKAASHAARGARAEWLSPGHFSQIFICAYSPASALATTRAGRAPVRHIEAVSASSGPPLQTLSALRQKRLGSGARRTPCAKATVQMQLDARGPRVGTQVAVMRLDGAAHLYYGGQQPLRAGTHVHENSGQPQPSRWLLLWPAWRPLSAPPHPCG